MISPRWDGTRDYVSTVHDVLLDLLMPDDEQIYELIAITRPASFRGGDISSSAQEYTAVAREKHLAEGFGYWAFLLGSLASGPREIRQPVITRAGLHTSGEAHVTSAAELRSKIEDGSLVGVEDRSMFSLSSRVRNSSGDTIGHLPMLDFSLKSTPQNDEVALEVLDSLNLSGFLFDSGRSYHFLGEHPVDADAQRVLLARAQLVAPYIDSRWISHSLIEGRCALRISSDTSRNTELPRLVARSTRRR